MVQRSELPPGRSSSPDSSSRGLPLKKHFMTYIESATEPEQKRRFMAHGLGSEDADFVIGMPLKQQDAIFRKFDYRVVPMLALLYLVAHLSRAIIGNAKLEGIEKSLGMSCTD